MENGKMKITWESEFGTRTVECDDCTTSDTMVQLFAGLMVSEGYFISSVVKSMLRYAEDYPGLAKDDFDDDKDFD